MLQGIAVTKNSNFLIYGSYGYTGSLIAELSVKQGLNPVLGGRNKEQLIRQSNALNLEYRVFDLEDVEQTTKILEDFTAVLHCAGPFINTYSKMVQACLAAGTHYVDITGEVQVIEQLMTLNEQAKLAGIMILPGAGFDVVPSDCLARYLKSKLPDAIELILAIGFLQKGVKSGSRVSRGTARTMMSGFSEGTLIRENGHLMQNSKNWKMRTFDFGLKKSLTCATISWGDLASAWWSTGIPHIETYMALPRKVIQLHQWVNPVKSLFKWAPIQHLIDYKIRRLPEGPSRDERHNSLSKIYGEVINREGIKKAALMTTPNGYELTSIISLVIMKHILAGNAPVGFQTPSTAYTEHLIMEVPEVTLNDVV